MFGKVKARLRKRKLDLRRDVFEMGEILGFRDRVIHDLAKMQLVGLSSCIGDSLN